MSIEVFKLKRGTMYRAVLCKNRQRISKTFERKYDAQRWLEEQGRLDRTSYKKNLCFFEASQTWIENYSKVRTAPSTHQGDKAMMESFKAFFGDIPLEKISPERVEDLISQKLTEGLQSPTVNRYLQCLRGFLNYFVKKRQLISNAVSIVGLLKENEVAFDYLSFEEADRFLAYANQKYRDRDRWTYLLYVLSLNTGLRWGEIAALKWDRVDFQHQRLTISRSYCGKSYQIRETTKGRKIRYVGINTALYPELKAHFEAHTHPDNLVFSQNGRTLNLENFKRDRFRKDLTDSGIRMIRFHDLRHSFASHFMMKGGNLYDLQKLMGHSDVKTTERYAHLSPEFLVRQTELVAIDGGRNNVIPLDEFRAQNA